MVFGNIGSVTMDIAGFRLGKCIGKACSGLVKGNLSNGQRPPCATVAVAVQEQSGSLCCIRVCDLDIFDKRAFATIQNEIAIIRRLKHENILHFGRIFLKDNFLCFTMPLMEYGSITDVMHKKFLFGLDEEAVLLILWDVCLALSYVHSQNLIHRSIRCSHILISKDGKARLSGFRHCVPTTTCRKRSQNQFCDQSEPNLLWLAPEILEQGLCGYDRRSDIYSLGITTCEMANGFPPFADMDHMQMLFEKLRGTTPRLLDSITLSESNQNHDQRSRTFSKDLHNFTEVCLKKSPTERPTIEQLMKHSAFRSINKIKITLTEYLSDLKPITL